MLVPAMNMHVAKDTRFGKREHKEIVSTEGRKYGTRRWLRRDEWLRLLAGLAVGGLVGGGPPHEVGQDGGQQPNRAAMAATSSAKRSCRGL